MRSPGFAVTRLVEDGFTSRTVMLLAPTDKYLAIVVPFMVRFWHNGLVEQRSARHPVKVEVAGSNPVRSARDAKCLIEFRRKVSRQSACIPERLQVLAGVYSASWPGIAPQ
jgi:hypothetical protein